MGVYIKGMEIPANCGECRFAGVCGVHSVDEWPDIESIILNDVIGVGGKRDENCPLVEVLPHGDLISREWLIDIALHLMNTAKNDDIANGVKWLWQYIIDAPTIILASEESET